MLYFGGDFFWLEVAVCLCVWRGGGGGVVRQVKINVGLVLCSFSLEVSFPSCEIRIFIPLIWTPDVQVLKRKMSGVFSVD